VEDVIIGAKKIKNWSGEESKNNTNIEYQMIIIYIHRIMYHLYMILR